MMGPVAPHAGAWIETLSRLAYMYDAVVAPHAGAWIETVILNLHQCSGRVAPHAGAWIETCASGAGVPLACKSRLTRARGLKLCVHGPPVAMRAGRASRGRVD